MPLDGILFLAAAAARNRDFFWLQKYFLLLSILEKQPILLPVYSLYDAIYYCYLVLT